MDGRALALSATVANGEQRDIMLDMIERSDRDRTLIGVRGHSLVIAKTRS